MCSGGGSSARIILAVIVAKVLAKISDRTKIQQLQQNQRINNKQKLKKGR